MKENLLESIDNIEIVEQQSETDMLYSVMEYYQHFLDVLTYIPASTNLDDFYLFQESLLIMEADTKKDDEQFTFRKVDPKTGKKENILWSIIAAIPRLIKAIFKSIVKFFKPPKQEKVSATQVDLVGAIVDMAHGNGSVENLLEQGGKTIVPLAITFGVGKFAFNKLKDASNGNNNNDDSNENNNDEEVKKLKEELETLKQTENTDKTRIQELETLISQKEQENEQLKNELETVKNSYNEASGKLLELSQKPSIIDKMEKAKKVKAMQQKITELNHQIEHLKDIETQLHDETKKMLI